MPPVRCGGEAAARTIPSSVQPREACDSDGRSEPGSPAGYASVASRRNASGVIRKTVQSSIATAPSLK